MRGPEAVGLDHGPHPGPDILQPGALRRFLSASSRGGSGAHLQRHHGEFVAHLRGRSGPSPLPTRRSDWFSPSPASTQTTMRSSPSANPLWRERAR